MWDDIQSLFQQHQTDVTELTKQVADLSIKKCDKKELTSRSSQLQTMIQTSRQDDLGTRLVEMNSELTEKIADIKQDFFRKIQD